MDNNKRLEGEEIQKGLESFLEQELDLDMTLAQPEPKPTLQDPIVYRKPKPEPDLSLAPMAEEGITERRQTAKKIVPQKKTVPVKKPVEKKTTQTDKLASNTERKQKKPMGKVQTKKKRNTKKKGSKKKDNNKNKKNRFAKVLIIIAAIFVLGFVGLYALVGSVYSKMNYKEIESVSRESMKEDGVINVLLIGNDSRSEGEDGRSDAMILVSISDKTKTITMTSLLRDMYVEIPGHDGNRLNAAYSYGGPELLMETIEYNFDIPVHRYALVNFQAFANLVDAVGGVDLELTNDEVQYVNGYLMEYNQLEGRDLATDFLDPSLSGMIHLNGPQALAYTRNRYIGTDFGRTERQRKVLGEVFGKLPGAVVTNGGDVVDGLFPNLTTNLEQGECFNIALNGWKIVGYDMVQQAVPVEGTYSNANIRGMAVLEVDFEANKVFLQETLYGN